MRDIWISSDTHFNHKNILTFTDSNTGKKVRPLFEDVNHMNEYMIEKHNSVVKPGDIHYHLGDVFFGSKDEFKKLWPRLNGKKRLVVGNHDDIPFLSSGGFFQKVMMWRLFKDFGLLLTHAPVHHDVLEDRRGRRTDLTNIHGHKHQNPSPEGPYKCVCVEQIDYTPVHIEELRTRREL